MSDDAEPQHDDWPWRDVEQHQARALKRLDADADNAPLADGSGAPLSPPGAQAAADLARAVAQDVLAAGFTVHDCAGKAPGGVCLTPSSDGKGVLVAWTQHDAAEAVFGYGRHRDLQEHMNYALADALTMLGYPVEGYGHASAHIVTGPRTPDEADDDNGEDDEDG
jgi:hypothetical protein